MEPAPEAIMNFRLKSKHLSWALIGMALAYMGLGTVQALTPYRLGSELGKNIDTVFFVAAAGLFIYMQQLRKKETAEREAAREAERAAATPEAAPADPAPADETSTASTTGSPSESTTPAKPD
jgi:hypothetical protein